MNDPFREAHQRSAPPHVAGHDEPQLRRQDPARLYPPHRDLCQVSRPRAGYGDRRRHPPLPGRQQIAHGAQPPKMNTQASALRFFLGDHVRPRRPRPSDRPHALSQEAAAHALRRGCRRACSTAAPGPGLKYKAALERGLWRGPARRRGRHAARRRHRQPAHADPRRDGQGPQGPARDAVAATARRCCAPGGCNAARRAGCSRAAIRCCR